MNRHPEPGSEPTPPFAVLLVCTGNICRSPLASQLLDARCAAAGLPVSVRSAGTGALEGAPMTPEAAALSVRSGGDPRGHAGRQLTAELVDGADLILTATREHRREVVTLVPRASARTFTLRQFARLAEADAEARVHARVEAEAPPGQIRLAAYVSRLAAARGVVPAPPDLADDDIVDPYRESLAVYARVGAEIEASVVAITAGFARALDG